MLISIAELNAIYPPFAGEQFVSYALVSGGAGNTHTFQIEFLPRFDSSGVGSPEVNAYRLSLQGKLCVKFVRQVLRLACIPIRWTSCKGTTLMKISCVTSVLSVNAMQVVFFLPGRVDHSYVFIMTAQLKFHLCVKADRETPILCSRPHRIKVHTLTLSL